MTNREPLTDQRFSWGLSYVGDIVQRRDGGPRMEFVAFNRDGRAICEWTEPRRLLGIGPVREVKVRGKFHCHELLRLESAERLNAEALAKRYGMAPGDDVVDCGGGVP